MKKLLLVAILGVLISGCGGVTRETKRYQRPTNYVQAMEQLGEQLSILDKNVVDPLVLAVPPFLRLKARVKQAC